MGHAVRVEVFMITLTLKDAGQDEEADQGKDDVSMVIKITQMTIKMKMNQYKDDIHQDEDDEYQHKED